MYKNSSESRAVYDRSPLTDWEEYSSPEFKLPSFIDVLNECDKSDYVIKFDLRNGFYHLPLCPQARKYFRIKCGEFYFRFKKLFWGGGAVSPYLMQCIFKDICNRVAELLPSKQIIYLGLHTLTFCRKELKSPRK